MMMMMMMMMMIMILRGKRTICLVTTAVLLVIRYYCNTEFVGSLLLFVNRHFLVKKYGLGANISLLKNMP